MNCCMSELLSPSRSSGWAQRLPACASQRPSTSRYNSMAVAASSTEECPCWPTYGQQREHRWAREAGAPPNPQGPAHSPRDHAHSARAPPTSWSHLDLLVQQLQGQALEGHAGARGGALGAQQAGHAGGVARVAARVGVLEGLEVVVQRVAHHHLPLEQLEDLGAGRGSGTVRDPSVPAGAPPPHEPPPPALTSFRATWKGTALLRCCRVIPLQRLRKSVTGRSGRTYLS